MVLVQNDMVRWYVFDIATILISIRIGEFFILRDVGSTYLTVLASFGQLAELSQLISSTQPFVFQIYNFLREVR